MKSTYYLKVFAYRCIVFVSSNHTIVSILSGRHKSALQ